MKHWAFDFARFAAERSRLGMTLEEFADFLDLRGGRRRAWTYESGSRQPSLRTLTSIAGALDLPFTDFMLKQSDADARMALMSRWRDGEFGVEFFHTVFDREVGDA